MTTTLPHTVGAPFASRPQKFPRTQRKAAEVAGRLHGILKKTPRTLVATVVNTANHVSMGYVDATTDLGVVKVHGVPIGSVVPGMRLFVRQFGPQGSNQSFVFDGYAPALSIRGLDSGSLIYSLPSGLSTAQAFASTDAGGIPTTAALAAGVTGYYWHCFFYLPVIPQSRCTLFQMAVTGGGTNLLTLEYLPSGYMLFRSAENNHGYTTTAPVAPHQMHWLQIQPGLGSSTDWLLDGVASYTGIQSGADAPYFNSAGASYTGSFLSNVDGTQLCPLGTWISKFGFGASSLSGVTQLSTGFSTPTSDSQIPTLNSASTMQTETLLLMTDTPGGTALANGATGSSGSGVTISTPTFQLIAPGPY